ncbi:MAG: aminoacyl-tRNA hydrolase [Candidatus Promineifilaceae bacterium]
MERYLLAGLGNPGRAYREQRHNIGFMALDWLAERSGIAFSRLQGQALVATGEIAGRSVILAKPQTYMNQSGRAISALMRFYKLELEYLLVIYDEIDLPFGTLRLRDQGGSGGHNGMKSVIQHLGPNFARLRLGVGRPPGRMEAVDYVLQEFGRDEQRELGDILERAGAAVETFLRSGVVLAMSRHNGPPAAQELSDAE